MARLMGGSGGGGSSTVTTDGVTIQGDGSGGSPIAIKQVETSARLTGAGTLASPLEVAALCTRIYVGGNDGNTFNVGSANNIAGGETQVWYPTVISNVAVGVLTADAVNLYDIGLYNAALSLIAHIGAQTLPATGFQHFALVGAPITLFPGLYYYAFTGNSTTAVLRQLDLNNYIYRYALRQAMTSTVSASGVLPSTIVQPTDNFGIPALQVTFYS
jgi:hypothetical protein